MEPNEPDYNFSLTCSMIRVEVRCPPPHLRLPRSGCMLFDLRGLTIRNGPLSTEPSVRFSEETQFSSSESVSDVILNVRLQEILVAYSTVGDNMANAILILGFLPAQEINPDTSALWATETVSDPLPLSVIVERHNVIKKSGLNSANRLSVVVNIPLVNLVMDKVVLDGVQCWADDVAQLVERSFATPDSATETIASHNPSLIGSRYFAQLRRGGTQSTDEIVMEGSNRQTVGETVIKVTVTEGKSSFRKRKTTLMSFLPVLLRFVVLRNGESHHARPLDISVLDISALLELKPDGKVCSSSQVI